MAQYRYRKVRSHFRLKQNIGLAVDELGFVAAIGCQVVFDRAAK